MPRGIEAGAVLPVMKAGIKSAHSTQAAAAAKTFGAVRLQCSTFDQNHSLLYVPPHLLR